MSKPTGKSLNEYQAAVVTGLSPALLRWLVKYTPKKGQTRKLKFKNQKKGTYIFDEVELRAFNEWLKSPWPKYNNQRPPIPAGIKKEIRIEANGACAVCQSHKDTVELAHIDPVHKSNNNHPENLILLCSNHHTAFDKDLYGPKDDEKEFVRDLKRVLHKYKRMVWAMQDELSQKLFIALDTCDALAKNLAIAKTREQVKAATALGNKLLAELPSLAPLSRADANYESYRKISGDLALLKGSKESVPKRLAEAQKIRADYVAAAGFVTCPLCKGTGRHEGSDCPVCDGNREIDASLAREVDLNQYERVDCPLCQGSGAFQGNDCPACGGDQTMDRRFAEQLDLSDYREVHCPLCKGTGLHKGKDCPVCEGDAAMQRRHAEQIDTREYAEVDCPLCKGKGRFKEDDCPACDGEARMERRYAEQIELRDFQEVDCPVCKGTGNLRGEECRACSGNRTMERRQADQIDLSYYKS